MSLILFASPFIHPLEKGDPKMLTEMLTDLPSKFIAIQTPEILKELGCSGIQLLLFTISNNNI